MDFIHTNGCNYQSIAPVEIIMLGFSSSVALADILRDKGSHKPDSDHNLIQINI